MKNNFLSVLTGELITFEQAQAVNLQLAKIKVNTLSVEECSYVKDYLATALNMDSVDINILPSLDLLLVSLN